MGRMGRIFDFQFLIFDLLRRAAASFKSQIKNLKSKMAHPAHPVHPC
jgi:hypothetical protein